MKTLVNMFTCTLMFAGVLALTACNSSSQSTTEPSATGAVTTSIAPTMSPSPSQSTTASPDGSPSPTAEPVATVDETSMQLEELVQLAKQGKAPGIKYEAHLGLIDDVEKEWGKADKQDFVGSSGSYWTYTKKNAVIGFNKGSQIFDVRSSDPALQKLTLIQIKAALGNPSDIKVNGDDTIYIYKVSAQYELKFIIPKSTGKVDHISVFSPHDSINNMAG